MGDDERSNCRVGQVGGHGQLYDREKLADVCAEGGEAEDAIVFSDEGFDEAASLTHLNRPGYVSHRQLSHANVQAALASFRLGQPNPTELRVNIAQVYLAKHRVSALLKKEIARLGGARA